MSKPARFLFPALVFAIATAPLPALASDKGWDNASTVVRDGLILTALAVPAAKGDWNGALQAGGSLAVTGGATYVLKHSFHEIRPDGTDRLSFPSGHTSIAFAAAANLENRFGWKIGIPAHVAAIFVGVARVKAHRHFWYDAAAGAALGEVTGLLLTRRHDANVQLFPWSDHRAGGLTVAARF